MKYLPRESIIYTTNLKTADVINRITHLIKRETIPGLFGKISINEYEGEINGHAFSIKRNTYHRENFLPLITGTIDQSIDGTTIKVSMKTNNPITVFLYIWATLFGLIFLYYGTMALVNWELNAWSISSFIMLAWAYIYSMIGFKVESKKSINDLALLFEADFTHQ